jgi:hypothetical protein
LGKKGDVGNSITFSFDCKLAIIKYQLNRSMKYILTDVTNDGIIYIGDNLPTTNLIKSGLADAEVWLLYSYHPCYNSISRKGLFEDRRMWRFNRNTFDVIEMSGEMLNEAYLEKLRLVRLRYTISERLMALVHVACLPAKTSPFEGFENNLAFAIAQCDPKTETWSNAIIEYAQINQIEPYVAYKEIKLKVESVHSLRMRVYAWQMYFNSLINNIKTQEDLDAVREELFTRFIKDLRI